MTNVELERPEDAASIVALHNAAPDLIRAVRERDALRTAVLALADELDAGADEDEQWLNGPRVSVNEAQELPAMIRQARSHATDIRAVVEAATPDA